MGEQKAPKVTAADGGRAGRRIRMIRPNAKLLFGGVLVCVLLIGTGIYIVMQGRKDDGAKQQQAASNPLEEIDVTYEQLSNDQLMNKVNYLIGTQQYTEAEKLIKTQKGYDTSSEKLRLLLAVQTSSGEKEQSAETADRLASLPGLQPGEYAQIAAKYEADGNKQKAIDAYTKAIDGYNEAKIGSYKSDVRRLEEKVKALQ